MALSCCTFCLSIFAYVLGEPILAKDVCDRWRFGRDMHLTENKAGSYQQEPTCDPPDYVYVKKSREHGENVTSEGLWSEWSVFSPCSASCGHAVRVRSRKCLSTIVECVGDVSQEETCAFVTCPSDKTDKVRDNKEEMRMADDDVQDDKGNDDDAGRENFDEAEQIEENVAEDEPFVDDNGDGEKNEQPEIEEEINEENAENVHHEPDDDDVFDEQDGDDTGNDGETKYGNEEEGRNSGMGDDTGDGGSGDNRGSGGSGGESEGFKKKKRNDYEDEEEEDKDEEEEKEKKNKRKRKRRKKKRKNETGSSSSSSESYTDSDSSSGESECSATLLSNRPVFLQLPRKCLSIQIQPRRSSYGVLSSPNADVDDDLVESDSVPSTASPDVPSPCFHTTSSFVPPLPTSKNDDQASI